MLLRRPENRNLLGQLRIEVVQIVDIFDPNQWNVLHDSEHVLSGG